MQTKQVELEPGWLNKLSSEFQKPYMKKIKSFLLNEKQAGKTIYPPGEQLFHAFKLTPFDKTRVVIIGQDPYHGPGQAHGLCFSVPYGVKPPPSLVNIFKELKQDAGCSIPDHGNLVHWANQGVLLINAILTVEANKAASHSKIGWNHFTDAAISALNSSKEGLVFLLWGKYAQSKEQLVDAEKHFILKAPHPSPFSADRGFFGCRHFSLTNEILTARGQEPIDWQLPMQTEKEF